MCFLFCGRVVCFVCVVSLIFCCFVHACVLCWCCPAVLLCVSSGGGNGVGCMCVFSLCVVVCVLACVVLCSVCACVLF